MPVSARAGQIGAQSMAQIGAVAALEMPFTSEVLRDVVARALRSDNGHLPAHTDDSSPNANSGTGVTLSLLDSVHPVIDPPGLESSTKWLSNCPDDAFAIDTRATLTPPPGVPCEDPGLERLTGALAHALFPLISDVAASEVTLDEATLAQSLRKHTSENGWLTLADCLRRRDPVLWGFVVLDGVLGQVPLGEIFQLLSLQAQPGLLVIERDGPTRDLSTAKITVAFRNGRIDQAMGHGLGDEFLLGRYFVSDGMLNPDEFETRLEDFGPRGTHFGSTLVVAGRIDAQALDRAITRQSIEMPNEFFQWTSGRSRFELGAVLPEYRRARPALSGETLVLEGWRRIDDWQLIEPYVTLDAVVARDEGLLSTAAIDHLDVDERRVFASVNGHRTVRKLVESLGFFTFYTAKVLSRLVQSLPVAVVDR